MILSNPSNNAQPFKIEQNLKWSFLFLEYIVSFLNKSTKFEDHPLTIVHVADELFNEGP